MDLPCHGMRPGHGVELSNDVLLLILDNIVSVSDLKALCLTSKALRSLATPRLYHTVHIPLWDETKVEAFYESVGCGAGLHLNNTRVLIFEDDHPPDEPNCSLVGPLAFPIPSSQVKSRWSEKLGYSEGVTDEDKDRTMTVIFHFFAKTEQLATLRFISSRPQPNNVLVGLLAKHFESLRDLQCTLDDDGGLYRSQEGKELRLRSLDLMMAREWAVGGLTSLIIPSAHTLESLSIGCLETPENADLRLSISTRLATTLNHIPYILSLRLEHLKALKLRYLDVSLAQSWLSGVINMSSLSSLSIYDCRGTIEFFSFAHRANDASFMPLELKHFALRVLDDLNQDIARTDIEAAKLYIDGIISSTTLESLHLSWHESHLGKYLYTMRPKAPNLLSFSSHESTNDPWIDPDYFTYLTEWEDTLRDKLKGCPKLLAFGYRIPEVRSQMLQSEEDEAYLDEPFLDILKQASSLRVLHLRQRNYLAKDEVFDQAGMVMKLKSADAYAFCMQRWASTFFEYLHTRRWCTNLKALILRCQVVYHEDYGGDHGGSAYYMPQCCYVKGFQTDVFGRTGVVAIPVSRARLRASEPWADILDYDPECNWNVGQGRTE